MLQNMGVKYNWATLDLQHKADLAVENKGFHLYWLKSP